MADYYLILHILSTFILFCIFIFFYYKFISKWIKLLDKTNSIKKESTSIFFKYLAPVIFIVCLIILVVSNYVHLSLSRMSFGLIILSFIFSLSLFSFLIIPIFASLYYLNKSDLKSYFKRFFMHSIIVDILTIILINFSSIVFLFTYCKFNSCQSESGLLIIIIGYYSIIFSISFIVFSIFISIILLLIKKGYVKHIFILLSIILIISASYNVHINRPVSHYLQKAIDYNDISYCDNVAKNTKRSVDYIIDECKTQFIILNNLGSSYCNQYIGDLQRRDLCIFEYALRDDNIKICNDINIYDWNTNSSKTYCGFIFNMKSSSECALFNEIKDTITYYRPYTGVVKESSCIIDYAIRMKNPKICNDVADNKDDCYAKLAFTLNDENICDSISKGNLKSYNKRILDCKENIIEINN